MLLPSVGSKQFFLDCFDPEDWGSKLLRKSDNYSPKDTASYPKTLDTSDTKKWDITFIMQPPKPMLCCYTHFNWMSRKFVISEHMTKAVYINSTQDALQRDTGVWWNTLIKNTLAFCTHQLPVPMASSWTSCKIILTWCLSATINVQINIKITCVCCTFLYLFIQARPWKHTSSISYAHFLLTG